ncbi:MAG: hypothetical protein AB9861_12415 [Methanosarcina sp.]
MHDQDFPRRQDIEVWIQRKAFPGYPCKTFPASLFLCYFAAAAVLPWQPFFQDKLCFQVSFVFRSAFFLAAAVQNKVFILVKFDENVRR